MACMCGDPYCEECGNPRLLNFVDKLAEDDDDFQRFLDNVGDDGQDLVLRFLDKALDHGWRQGWFDHAKALHDEAEREYEDWKRRHGVDDG